MPVVDYCMYNQNSNNMKREYHSPAVNEVSCMTSSFIAASVNPARTSRDRDNTKSNINDNDWGDIWNN